MKTQILFMPDMQSPSFGKVNSVFMKDVVDALLIVKDAEEAHEKLHRLFAQKLSDKRILFDYGFSNTGIIVKYDGQVTFYAECDVTEFLEKDD